MVTGYFIFPKYIFTSEKKPILPVGFLNKTALLYAGVSLLYLPVSIYAGYYSRGNVAASILRNIVFDGTFYHLWYLPASIIGVLIIFLLARIFAFRTVLGITVFLYILGMLGDSYYGFTSNIPVLNTVYAAGFQAFSYTRNGIFLAPVFLAMGGWLSQLKLSPNTKTSIIGFVISLSLMLAEGMLLYLHGLPRHDSMYIFLLPCMFFLFQIILQHNNHEKPIRRDIAKYIFILHPLVIVAVRGSARVMGLGTLLVGNNMIHFFAVCVVCILLSIIAIKLHNHVRRVSS